VLFLLVFRHLETLRPPEATIWQQFNDLTSRELARIEAQVRRKGSRPRSATEIAMAVGTVLDSRK
jgi:hypothetical protein